VVDSTALAAGSASEDKTEPQVTSTRVFQVWDYPVFVALTAVVFAAFGYFFVYWFAGDGWQRNAIVFGALTLTIVFNLAMHQCRWFTFPLMRRPNPMPPLPGCRVAVVTTFVPGSEPLGMLEQTLTQLTALEYPHDTWVLDEGDADEVKAMCQRLGARHFSRKHLSRYHADHGPFAAATKYGNYNAWLVEIGYDRYDLISVFDPDHVPARTFLTKVLGFFADPRVAYVQAPQAYYNQRASFVARGAAEQTYAYSSSIQMADYAVGYPIIMGCHTTHRVNALRAVGGMAQHDADDLLLTLHYRVAGWRGVYLPEVIARGLTPVDWQGYLGQQRRWARAVLDVKFRIYPSIASKLPLHQRLIGYVHGLVYLQGLSPLVGIVLLAALLLTPNMPNVTAPELAPRVAVLLAALALAGAYRQRFFLGGPQEWGVHWRAMALEWAKWPWMLAAVLDLGIRRRAEFVITAKTRSKSQRHVLLVPHGLAAVAVILAWLVGATLGVDPGATIRLISAGFVIGSIGLIASEYLPFPEPYDPCLARDCGLSGGSTAHVGRRGDQPAAARE
jgi:hypothetical protein